MEMLATCHVEIEPGKECGFELPWDEHCEAMMRIHFASEHPGVDLDVR